MYKSYCRKTADFVKIRRNLTQISDLQKNGGETNGEGIRKM